MSSFPFVSVIIPTHGRPQFLLDTIASVMNQDYAGPKEVIVVDDGSPEPIEPLVHGQYPDVRVVRQPNTGCNAARRLGVIEARGPYLALNDDDDLWEPHKLRTQVELLEKHPEIDICITDFMKFSTEQVYTHTNFKDHNELWRCPNRQIESAPKTHLWEPKAYTPALLMGGPFPPQTQFTRKSFVERIGNWNKAIPGNGGDIEFGIRASWHGRVAFIDEPLTRVRRKHGGNISGNVTRTYVNVVRELAKASLDYPADLRQFMNDHLGQYYARVGWMLMRDGQFGPAAEHYRKAFEFGYKDPRARMKYWMCRLRAAKANA